MNQIKLGHHNSASVRFRSVSTALKFCYANDVGKSISGALFVSM